MVCVNEDLERLTKQSLEEIERMLPGGVELESPFTHQPEKGYTAKMVVNLPSKSGSSSKLNVVLFAPGDGTGDGGRSLWVSGDDDSEPIKLDYLEFKGIQDGDQMVPRMKRGVIAEALLPVGTFYNGCFYNGRVDLFASTLDPERNVVFGARLGEPFDPEELSDGFKPCPFDAYLTVGYDRGGERFGDPHAIFASEELGKHGIIQVAAFLTATERNSPEFEYIERFAVNRWI